ncbi:SsrA-binding protein SmpB [bacterium]|jgi:SsrA-binding protein|nr:SsrA-binding protein SmpB [bacterium]
MKNSQQVASNKKAFFNFEIVEKNEAGIVLTGCEIKSVRQGHVTIKESYVRIINNELWLINCNILPYSQGNRHNGNPARDRKLLIKKTEIKKLIGKTTQKGLVLVALSLYFKGSNLKVGFALARPKKTHDKRQVLKDKALNREIQRSSKIR